jgi:hypothetical protein
MHLRNRLQLLVFICNKGGTARVDVGAATLAAPPGNELIILLLPFMRYSCAYPTGVGCQVIGAIRPCLWLPVSLVWWIKNLGGMGAAASRWSVLLPRYVTAGQVVSWRAWLRLFCISFICPSYPTCERSDAMRFKCHARQTKPHFAATLSTPRKENCPACVRLVAATSMVSISTAACAL